MAEEKKYHITENGNKLYDSKVRAIKKYEQKAYRKILVRVRADEYDEIKEKIRATGSSVNSFIINAVKEKLEELEDF